MVIKKLDAEKYISECMEENPITLTDKLRNSKQFKNLTDYQLFLNSNLKTYVGKIEIYASRLNEEIERLESLITTVINYESEDRVKNNIESDIRSKLHLDYNRRKDIPIIFTDYLNNNLPNYSISTLTFIYDKYEQKGLDCYIRLLTRENTLTSSINNSDEIEREVAFIYLGLKIGQIDYKNLTKRSFSKKEIENLLSVYSQSINTINQEKQEYVSYLSEMKEQESNWFKTVQEDYNDFSDSSKRQVDDFINEANDRLETLEKTYAEKLKVEKPAEHMQNEANKYKKEVKKYSIIVGFIVAIIILLLYFIITPKIEFGNKTLLEITIFDNNIPIYTSLIIISIITLTLYFLRIFVKLLISSKHLETEYKQKYALTYFYLSLINNGNLTDEEVNNKILALLFSSPDTGLIKGDNYSSDMEKILLSLIGNK